MKVFSNLIFAYKLCNLEIFLKLFLDFINSNNTELCSLKCFLKTKGNKETRINDECKKEWRSSRVPH